MNDDVTSPPTLRRPLQKRSARTLARILVATIDLVEEKSLDEITIAEVADRAGVSVGTIYTRFADKETLLRHLVRQLLIKQVETFRVLFAESEWQGVSLDRRVLWLARLLVESAELQPGLQRAITRRSLTAGNRPDEEEQRLREQSGLIVESWLLVCRDEVTHPRPEAAVGFALKLAMTSVRGHILFPTDGRSLEGEELAAEIARSVLAYLTGEVSLPADVPPPHWPGPGFSEFPDLIERSTP